MRDENKTREQLIHELRQLRQQAGCRKTQQRISRTNCAIYQSLVDSMSEGMCLHEINYDELGEAVDYTILDVNPSYEAITGLDREHAIGKRASELYRTGTAPYLDVYVEVAESGQPTSFETYFPPMGKHFRVSVFSPHQGQFATIFSDVTEGKRAEEQLRRQGETLEAINRVLLETLTCETEKQVAQTCLAVAEALTGSKFGFIGQMNDAGRFDTIALSNPGWEACRVPESDAVAMIQNMAVRGLWGYVITKGESLIANDPNSHADSVGIPEGHPRLTAFLGVPLKYGGGTIGMIALANSDSGYDQHSQQAVETLSVAFVEALMRKRRDEELTQYREHLEELVDERTAQLRATNEKLQREALERELAEEALQQKTVKLAQANRAKSEFLANVSHELRTPLNSILGFAEVLEDGLCGDLNEEQKECVADIHEGGKHLLTMINDILDLSKVEAGRMELQLSTFSMAQTIADLLSIVRDMASKKRLSLQIAVLQDLPEVHADLVKFKQIMYNLLSNAVKFTPQSGTITISADFQDKEFLISVTDTGIGIEPDDQEIIFDEFTQVDSSQTRQYEGTGLGLALTRRLVELHGGRIWVESKGAGQGSRFSFTLPATQPENAVNNIATRRSSPNVAESAGAKGETILVVEDDLRAAQLLCIYLAEAGYSPIVVNNGEAAIRQAKAARPFAITLDIMLPRRDGWQVMQDLRNSPETRDIPVIIVSITDDQSLGVAMGASGYLVKPIDKQQLLTTIREIEQAQTNP